MPYIAPFEGPNRSLVSPREGVEKDTKERTLDLSSKITIEESRKAALRAQTPEKLQNAINDNADDFAKHMRVVGKELGSELAKNRWATRMKKAYSTNKDAPDVPITLQQIASKLTMPVPTMANPNSASHPYLRLTSTSIPGPHNAVQNDFRVADELYTDMRFVEGQLALEGISPEQRDVLEELLTVLRTYAANDEGVMAKQAILQIEKKSTTTKNIGEMGRMTAILGLGTVGVLLTGTVAMNAISKGETGLKDWLVPAGYLAVAIALAKPDLFNGKYTTAIEQMRTSIATKEYKEQAKKIKGKAAREVVSRSIDGDDMIKRIAAGDVPAEEKDTYVASLPLNKEDRKTVRTFLDDQQAVAVFSSKLRIITDKDTRDVALDLAEWSEPVFDVRIKSKAKLIESMQGETELA